MMDDLIKFMADAHRRSKPTTLIMSLGTAKAIVRLNALANLRSDDPKAGRRKKRRVVAAAIRKAGL